MTIFAKSMLAAALALVAIGGGASDEASAKSKTKKKAEIAASVLPISGPAKALVKANIKIYDRVGWEAGRLISTMQHGQSGDPGAYPGYNK